MVAQETRTFLKPKKQELLATAAQHIKILDCNQPISRVVFECWHCQQGLLSEVAVSSPQFLELQCPTCGKTALKLMGELYDSDSCL
jgi:Zn finger protein HypA/HybF involved in hydrogenase expression